MPSASTAGAFLLFGGALAILMRLQLAFPGNDFLSADFYNQAFTMHGSIMMFLVAVPLFDAFAILLLPQMLAARDLPFPRLSAYGYFCFLVGGVFVCGSILFGAAPSGGWFMYPPLTSDYMDGIGADIWLLGLSFIEIASIAAAVELIVAVLKCRPPGMTLGLMPLYAWYALIVGIMILLAFPPLIVGDIMLEVERAFDWPFFDAGRGGDALLWQHLFWIFGHPEVYIIFLPSLALAAMIVPTFARRPVIGYRWLVLSAVSVAFLSFGLWVHHMYVTGLPSVSLAFFSAASELVAIPTAISIIALVATVYCGRFVNSVPMLYMVGAFALFVLGGLTGMMVALVPFDVQAHDSYFVVAHLHYVLIGGMLMPVIGGVYYYYPIMAGRRLSDRMGRIAFWLLFAGFNITFLPMHLTGLLGMPRRVYTYPSIAGIDELNLLSTAGALVIAAGVLVLCVDVCRPNARKARSERNPWNAGTLEWLQRMPGENWGVRSVPPVSSRYPLWDDAALAANVDAGAYFLPDATAGLRETLLTTPVNAEPAQCLRVPGPTWITLIAALCTAGVFVFATYHWWLATGVASLCTLAAILYWLWTGTARIPERDTLDIGHGVTVPLYRAGPASVGWWALLITLIADLSAYASLVFAWFFYWTADAGFFSAAGRHPDVVWLGAAALLLVVAWLATLAADRLLGRLGKGGFAALQGLGAVCAGLAAAALLLAPRGLDPTAHVYPAMVWLLAGWTGAHLALGILMQGYCIARRAFGRLSARYAIDSRNTILYWHYAAATGLVTLGLLVLAPELA
ncbi:MAG TPA: cbb3-type cytochrome c oxidase subunit I [Woeseiaceae bacterium]|nr:cbb3-type cytochrome c oxidase subunit I [Woeseiaceae bacterium]